MNLFSKGLLLSILTLAVLFSGCNIFEFTASDDTVQGTIADGKQEMRDGNYDEAYAIFDEALQSDSLNSELLYLRAKAAIRRTGVNTIGLATDLQALDVESTTPADLPFMDRTEWPNTRADSLYQGILTATPDLQKILDGETEGFLDSADVQLDAVILFAVGGIMQFRDTNRDLVIDNNDFDLSIFFQDGNMNADSLKNMTPDEINDMLDDIILLLEDGTEALLDLLGEDTGLNNEDLEDVLNEIKGDTEFYRIELGVDNDGDGLIDEEWLDGVDEDGDGLTDEDSKGPRP